MKKTIVRLLILLMLLPGVSSAKTPPTYMQSTLAKLIENKAAKRGIPASDPRIAATLQGATSAAGGAAAAAAVITLAGVTAPAWVTAAAGTLLAAVFAYGIDLAIDSTVRWITNNDGSVTVYVAPPPFVPLPDQRWVWVGVGPAGQEVPVGFPLDDSNGSLPACTAIFGSGALYDVVSSSNYRCFIQVKEEHGGGPVQSASLCSVAACKSDPDPNYVPSPIVVKDASPSTAVETVTAQEKAKPANPKVIALLADKLWEEAASQPGYQGVPYDPSDPITVAEAEAVRSANPASWPTVGNILDPQPTAADGDSPFALSPSGGSQPPSTGGEGGSENPQPERPMIDWTLPTFGESVPAQKVSSTFVPTVFAAPSGCPAPITFEMLGKVHTISYSPFCDLMATLAPLFLATGAAAAALIFAQSLKS